jgi:hypothetical protein
MSFTIITTHTSNASGRAQVVAKGHGKQRTVSLDYSKSDDFNRGSALGALLNVLTNDEQKAKLRHPSAKQRVRVFSLTDGGGKHRWEVNV